MSTVIQSARAAIATAITTAGVKCLEYEGFDIPTQSPCASVTLDSADPENDYDQGFGFRRVRFLLRVYQQVHGNNAEQSLTYQDASIHLVLTALGVDRTIGGKVAWMDVTGFHHYFERIGSVAYSVAQYHVEVTPHANIG